MELFRVRLNCVDYYQAQPTPYDPQLRRNMSPSELQNEPRVPVIRVFGSTETGQKVCAHIHGAFPYLYIEYHGSLQPDVGKALVKLMGILVLIHLTSQRIHVLSASFH